MHLLRAIATLASLGTVSYAATFGTVVNVTGGASDIVMDNARGRLYLVRPAPYNFVDFYSITQRRVITSVRTDSLPLTAAISRDGRFLYVTCYDATSLNVIDIDNQRLTARIALPAKPEAVAVGADGRVLITTIGTGQGNSSNSLLIYDPSAGFTSQSLTSVQITPPAPQSPILPPNAGRIVLATRSQLMATPDGRRIVGVNAPNNNTRTVFVYESASGTVLRSRSVTGDTSTVISVSPDGTKFMMGLRLFETDTLTVLAQQNAANATFPLSTNIAAQGFNAIAQQFNVQQNQGGSVFSPDGSVLFSSFNIAPIQNPPARPNIAHLLLNDPDNLLINQAFQMPENLAGKIVSSADGANLFALSESGFVIIPLSEANANPIVMPSSRVVLLGNDQCGVIDAARRTQVGLPNVGRGLAGGRPLIITPQLVQSLATTNVQGLGQQGGGGFPGGPGGFPGGGAPGGGVVINLPGVPGAGLPGQLPGGFGGNQQAAQITLTAPQTQVTRNPDGSSAFAFSFNAQAGRSIGTVPSHDFLIQAPDAINVPPTIRVFQNNRDSDARASVIPVETAISPNEALVDIAPDYVRNRLYISNSGLNRVEVFDMKTNRFIARIKVGQLPRTLAVTPDSNTLYVANSGGESISIIDLDRLVVTGRVKFPPLPFNGAQAIVTPSVIAASQRGLQIIMSNGTLWKVIGNEAIPRAISPIIGTATVPAPRTMVATPNGEFVLMLDGNGFANLYDASVDDFVQRRQVMTAPIQGFYGPIGAGPRGQYFLVNGFVLNPSLSPVASAGVQFVTPGNGGFGPGQQQPGRVQAPTAAQAFSRPVAAVIPAGNGAFARFVLPVVANNNTAVSDSPAVEIVDVNTGFATRTASTIEAPTSTVVGTQRVNVGGRTMALNADSTIAYILTVSGLSVVPIDPVNPNDRPVLTQNGTVNSASLLPTVSSGGLISIFGRNLASSASTTNSPLPTLLGGACVTLNNVPLPLIMTSAGQINAQLPPDLAAGRYPLIVRSIDRKAASQQQALAVLKYAPALFVDPTAKTASVFHIDESPVTPDNPAHRDEDLTILATGMGPVKGVKLIAGTAAPASPAAVTDPVKVFFGDPRYKEAEIIVESSVAAPGQVGVFRLKVRVPGAHLRGNALAVTVRVGGVDSPKTGPAVPTIAVD